MGIGWRVPGAHCSPLEAALQLQSFGENNSVLQLRTMESEHFSCDEEDFDTFSSVSSPGGGVIYDRRYSKSWEDGEGYSGQNMGSILAEDSPHEETSSQVARSIISGLFRSVTRKDDVVEEEKSGENIIDNDEKEVLTKMTVVNRSTSLDFEGSDCSETEYQIVGMKQKVECDNFDSVPTEHIVPPQTPLEDYNPEKTEGQAHSVISHNSSKSCIKSNSKYAASVYGDNSSDIQDMVSDITKSNSSFTARITDWINNVSLKEDDLKDNTRSVSFQESIQCSTPVENVIICDGSVYSEEDDQPAGYTAPVTSMDLVTGQHNNMDLQKLEEKFQSEARTNISGSLVPTTAFTSFDQGFSSVQQSNGKELFDNGLIRHRLTGSYIKNIPFPAPRNYHIRVTETTEQKMRLEKDGSQVIDTTHTREQSEKTFDEDQERGLVRFMKRFLLLASLLIILSVGMFVLLQLLQIVEVKGLSCFMETNGFLEKLRSDKQTGVGV